MVHGALEQGAAGVAEEVGGADDFADGPGSVEQLQHPLRFGARAGAVAEILQRQRDQPGRLDGGQLPLPLRLAQRRQRLLGPAGQEPQLRPEGVKAHPVVLIALGVEEPLGGRPLQHVLVERDRDVLVVPRGPAQLGQLDGHLQERQHHLFGARRRLLAKLADVLLQAGHRPHEAVVGLVEVARLAPRARKANLRGSEAGRRRQHLAELGLGAVEVAKLLEVDLPERPAGQHLGLASQRRRPAQHAHGLLRIGQAQLEGRLPDVIQDAHRFSA